MRIGFLLPGAFALGNPGNGIAEQARRQAEALERRGHTVLRLNPWDWQDETQLDVLHFFLGGPALHGITSNRQLARKALLVFAPIIDSNQSFMSYRIAALAGSVSSRFLTVPGMLRRQACGSHVVICRSRHERERLVQGLGVPPDKVERVLNGCPPAMMPTTDREALRERLRLPKDFVLHVSAFTQERKNVLRLVEALEPLQLPLVIAGASTPGQILSELERKARAGAPIHMLGFVDAQTKAALYSLCRVFCLPSHHEGTGLAALEAAAHGARIVVTRNGGAPDYFQDYADYVDPLDVAGMRAALARAWERPNPDDLQRHVNQRLTWDASAESLERAYETHRARA